jgi:hypothetical protein
MMGDPVFDLLGIAPLLGDRVVYCRCGVQGERWLGLTVAYVCGLEPLMVFEPELGRFTQILDSRQLVIVEYSKTESAVWKELGGSGKR